MEACKAVGNEIDKIVSKMQSFEKHSSSTLQDLIDSISVMIQELNHGGENEDLHQAHIMVLETYIKKIRDLTSSLASQHRDLHGNVSKVGKVLEKNFCADLAAISKTGLFDDEKNQNLIHRVICEHFMRSGQNDIAKLFMSETNVEVPEDFGEPFEELNAILTALRGRDLEPALRWVATHREALTANRSKLEIELQKLKFIRLLRNGATGRELCDYARQNLQHLAEHHEKDIQMLMGCLMFRTEDALARTSYAHLLKDETWSDICELFSRDACSVLGFGLESPLSVCVNAGCVAVSSLMNIKQVMQLRQVNVWSHNDELPIEIHLDRKHQFHSVFACPILRQQCSVVNPPMRLACGHVISQDALQKLANSSKLKCPYCPDEQSPNDAKEIYF